MFRFLLRSLQDYQHNGRQCCGCHSALTVLNEPPAELHVLGGFIGALTRVFSPLDISVNIHPGRVREAQVSVTRERKKKKVALIRKNKTFFFLFFSVSRSTKKNNADSARLSSPEGVLSGSFLISCQWREMFERENPLEIMMLWLVLADQA